MLSFKTIYPHWRLCVVHVVAKALGILVHVEGIPLGSTRIRRSVVSGNEGRHGGSLRPEVL